MKWNGINEFFAMGGYAFYVWGAFGMAILLMIAEVILTLNRKRTLSQQLGRRMRMQGGAKA